MFCLLLKNGPVNWVINSKQVITTEPNTNEARTERMDVDWMLNPDMVDFTSHLSCCCFQENGNQGPSAEEEKLR